MKKFTRTILRIVWILSVCVPMFLGFIIGLVRDAFQAGLVNAKDFVRWV